MSLKSKLEAVIYAAEEPVTLSQLATLFGTEALEWKAAQQPDAAQKAESEDAGDDVNYLGTGVDAGLIDPSQPISAPALQYLELRTEDGHLLDQPGFAVFPDGAAAAASDAAAPSGALTDITADARDMYIGDGDRPPAGDASSDPGLPSVQLSNQPSMQPEADAKRAARQRDREVKTILRQLIDELIAYYASDDRGVEIREIAGGYRMATKPECHDAVRMFIKSLKPPMKLSLPALETLAVIAYKQPVTAPEVNEIRGVDSSGVFGSLLARKLITTAGRKPVIGRPILYKTTREFLMRFGLRDVAELPSMDEFEKMASELEEAEPATMDHGDAATAANEAEGDGPALNENAPEEPENDTLSMAEDTEQPAVALSDTNENIEPTE